MPKAVLDRETSRREERQGSFLCPHTQRCPGRARRRLTVTMFKSIIITRADLSPITGQRATERLDSQQWALASK